jgi:molybdenum cofactor cytidylyltransferase
VIPAVVLAAGKSTRMGRTKATLPIGSVDTFLSRIVRTFHEGGVDEVVVVVGHDAESVRASLSERGVAPRIVENPRYELGQFSSLAAGLDAIDRPDVRAMLLTLVDVPFIASTTVRTVVDHYLRTHAPIVRPTRGSEHGHPVLIDRSVFDAVRAADRDTGAKPIVRAFASSTGDVFIDDEGAFFDVDTMADYLRALELFADRA